MVLLNRSYMEISGEIGPAQRTEYASPEEVETAKNGVAEFKELLDRSGYRTKRFLTKGGEAADMIQTMFLGLKPVSSIGVRDVGQVEKISFPERFHFVNGYLYDENLVAKTIRENPDIFSDFTPDADINFYIEEFLETNPDHKDSGESATRKIGLLHGFPKDAVNAFIKKNAYRSSASLYPEIQSHGIQFGIGDSTDEILSFPKKVDQLYKVSGMNDVIRQRSFVKSIIRRQF